MMVDNPDYEKYYFKLKSFLIRGNAIKNIAYYSVFTRARPGIY
jgi:hypothetical protein